ncbi:heme uptake protein IsdC [Viridibacillus sp. YIM B01967]|uniref:Heme uptake protein IsdC n=1 Tax=Viridibacillus soli TaxID=2798301 RepID=A0ABS1HDM8_9BACL|nr:heme uptake protein IsdC [Viridibacillus soli]MBK3497354.1 heme uptake protein IsdC [Viridibacillus soli]
MIKKVLIKPWLVAVVCLVAFILLPQNSGYAAMADGTYSVNYQVIKPDGNSASIANDYFAKPGTIIVKNGEMTAQIKVNNSKWMTSFSANTGGNSVVSSNASTDTRVVQFNVTSLSNPTLAKIKVDIEDMNYHHSYSIRLAFDESSAKLVSAAGSSSNKSDTSSSSKDTATTTADVKGKGNVDNPQTGDTTPILLFAGAFALSGFFLLRQRALKKVEEL